MKSLSLAFKIITKIKNIVSLVLAVIILVFIFSIFFDPILTIYNITAQTEKIQIVTMDANNSRLSLYGADVYDFDGNLILPDFHGSLELAPNVTADFQRISYGPLYLSITSEKEENIARFFNGENGKLAYTASENVEIVITNMDSLMEQGISIVLPLSGIINLGRSVGFETYGEQSPLLREGNVTMTAYSKMGDSYFEAGTKQLFMGDFLEFENWQHKAFGFLTINENPGMQVAYRVESKKARVIKPGPRDNDSGYPISASRYDRFISDRFYQSLSLFFAVLVVLGSLWSSFMDVRQFFKEKNKKTQ